MSLLSPLRFVRDWYSWWRRDFQPPYPSLVKRRTIAQYLDPESVFIETGTFLGQTSRWAGARCREVHTIEVSDSLYARISPGLEKAGIRTYKGDSTEVLPAILEELEARSVVIWLDAHWSGGITARAESGDTPVDSEVLQVESWFRKHPGIKFTLLVDDLRDFERDSEYPRLEFLIEFARRNDLEVRIANDIFAATT